MARKKTVNPLQKKIDRLTAKLADAEFEYSICAAAQASAAKQLAVTEGELEQVHALLDQQPGAPPREYTVNGVTYTPNLTARLMAWLAAR